MRVLADTNLFIKFCRRLPLPREVEDTLSDASTDRSLSPVSVIELFRHWQAGRVPDNPDSWLDLALPGWTVFPVTVPIARLSVLWSWDHRDPADRLLAATAQVDRGIEAVFESADLLTGCWQPPPRWKVWSCGTLTGP